MSKFNTYEMSNIKIRLIKEIDRKERRIKDVSSILEVSRQSVSKWLARYRYEGEEGLLPRKPGPKNSKAWNKTSKELEDKIIDIAKSNPFKGPDWITDQLEDSINQSTVYRILKRRGIRYYENYSHKRRKKKRYVLSHLGEEIQLDTCYPFGYEKDAIVYDAIDDCSRWVFAKVMPNKKEDTTIIFLEELIKKAPFKIKAIRSDNGTEFSNKVRSFLKSRGIELRKNPPYTPQHNGKIERYHRTFKEESACFWRFKASIEELNYELNKWLYFYNFKKKHSGLGMNKLTPVQKIAYTMIFNSFNQNKNVNLIMQQNIN